ncbi:MAG: tRNA (adenosine(37)-N6)-threonylcarbamoyltransferase complex dimerization subunit type 1 TsaB [Alphaproteobacteria bacterium]|nr:tRNA (adenosine(37)-N6)-threonylcarbamoyltransferase complex dimerization subunit type 1 TsaB [Alphaproteobacteria bacterium]
MKILAIDTTAWNCSVAFWEDGQELSFHEEVSERDQATILPQLVRNSLGNFLPDQVIVNLGPGSFTGIRVGLSFAKGFAMGLDIPLKGMDGFLINFLCLNNQKDVLILIEAHRKDVFGRRFIDGIPQQPQSLERKDLEKILKTSSPPFLAGNGIHPFLNGLDFTEISIPWQGAQKLAFTFFKNPTLFVEPHAFYAREADVSPLKKPCSSHH